MGMYTDNQRGKLIVRRKKRKKGGWYEDRPEHSLAARGISTVKGREYHSRPPKSGLMSSIRESHLSDKRRGFLSEAEQDEENARRDIEFKQRFDSDPFFRANLRAGRIRSLIEFIDNPELSEGDSLYYPIWGVRSKRDAKRDIRRRLESLEGDEYSLLMEHFTPKERARVREIGGI